MPLSATDDDSCNGNAVALQPIMEVEQGIGFLADQRCVVPHARALGVLLRSIIVERAEPDHLVTRMRPAGEKIGAVPYRSMTRVLVERS